MRLGNLSSYGTLRAAIVSKTRMKQSQNTSAKLSEEKIMSEEEANQSKAKSKSIPHHTAHQQKMENGWLFLFRGLGF